MEKIRADELLVHQGLTTTRSKAKDLIKKGAVFYNDKKITKAGTLLPPDAPLTLTETEQFVSRGAYKLQAAHQEFNIDFTNKIIADIGASTGGFTEYCLNHGAQKVYAIDVGHNQLVPQLQEDPRVINMEGTNIKSLTSLPDPIDLAVVDLSFISLTQVLETIFSLLKKNAPVIALVKPQFEAGPDIVNKHGIIKDPSTHQKILNNFQTWCTTHHITTKKLIPSPIKGKKGNKEFLALLEKA